jgi:6-phosphofructokinase 2
MNPAIDLSATADIVTDEKKLKCKTPKYDPGGGGINVSRAINILGGETKAVYPAGGYTGDLLEQLLKREEIQQHRIPIGKSTRINIHILEESTKKQYRFNMPGSEMNQDEWQTCLETLEDLSRESDFIVASGSLPPGVPVDFFRKIASLSHTHKAKCVLDTSGRPLRQALDEGVYVIKPNLREFTQLVNEKMIDEQNLIEKAKQLIDDNHCSIIVISMGASGSFFITKDEHKHICSPIVPINSRIGAGDCMTAGITLKLAMGSPPEEAVKYGVAAGSAAVMTPGTDLCRKKDAESIYRSMKEKGAD